MFLWCTKEVNCDSMADANFLISLSWEEKKKQNPKQLARGGESEWKCFVEVDDIFEHFLK